MTSSDTGTGTINNDDSATVIINDASASEGGDMTFTVSLEETVQGGLTVTPSFANGTAESGDYTENTTALSFSGTKGETKDFTVSTSEDAVLEANETFTVSLSVSDAPSGVTSTDTGTGTINNDDSATVTINDASASEGDGIEFTVTLDTAVENGLTVTPSYTNGTAESGDYTENMTALSFSGTKGETKTFTVATTEDVVFETDETFTVGLSVSNAPSGVTSGDTGTGTITNDESAAVTINDVSATEGTGIEFTVTLDTAVEDGLTVTPSFANGTAESGDYTEKTTALSFSGTAGETKKFTVSTVQDAVLEYNETFTVSLSVSAAPPGGDGQRHGHGYDHQRRQRHRHHRRRQCHRGHGHCVHGDAGYGGGRRLDGDAELCQRHGRERRLHGQHRGDRFHGHGQRDPNLYRGNHKRWGRRIR